MDELSLEKAEKMAAERNRKNALKYPLYANQMTVTAEQIKKAVETHRERFERVSRELQERGEAFRERVRMLVTAEELEALDARRKKLPTGPEYHADFWRREYEKRANT